MSAIPALKNHLARPDKTDRQAETLTRDPDASSPASAHPCAHSC